MKGKIKGMSEMDGYDDMMSMNVELDIPKGNKKKHDMNKSEMAGDDYRRCIQMPMSADEASEYSVGDEVEMSMAKSAKPAKASKRLKPAMSGMKGM